VDSRSIGDSLSLGDSSCVKCFVFAGGSNISRQKFEIVGSTRVKFVAAVCCSRLLLKSWS